MITAFPHVLLPERDGRIREPNVEVIFVRLAYHLIHVRTRRVGVRVHTRHLQKDDFRVTLLVKLKGSREAEAARSTDDDASILVDAGVAH